MMRTAILLALPAWAAAILNPCADDPSLPDTGVTICNPRGFETPLNTNCVAELRYECDTMYPPEQYSNMGIPCGLSTEVECAEQPAISFPNFFYPPSVITELSDVVASRLIRGRDNTGGASLFDTEELELYLTQESTLNITFLDEGACDRNSVGFVMFEPEDVTNGDPRQMNFFERRDLVRDKFKYTIMFPNADFLFCQCAESPPSYTDFCTTTVPNLEAGTTMRMIPDFRETRENLVFPANHFISFFLLDDGFDKGYRPGEVWEGFVEQMIFSTPELMDPDLVLRTSSGEDIRQHAFAFQLMDSVSTGGSEFEFPDRVFFCFEDRLRTGEAGRADNDFEDVCFFINAIPPLEGFEPSAAPSAGPGASDAPTSEICVDGLLSDCGNVCCASSCGQCGGCNCAEAMGGADLCCPATIVFNDVPCMSSSDVGCVVDADIVCPPPIPDGGC